MDTVVVLLVFASLTVLGLCVLNFGTLLLGLRGWPVLLILHLHFHGRGGHLAVALDAERVLVFVGEVVLPDRFQPYDP